MIVHITIFQEGRLSVDSGKNLPIDPLTVWRKIVLYNRVFSMRSNDHFQLLRVPRIIAIKKSDNITASLIEPGIESAGLPSICLKHRLDSSIFASILLDYITRIICRSIINNNALKITIALRKNGLKRIRQKSCIVIVIDNNGDARHTI